MSEESRSGLFGSVCPTQSAIPRCPENGECTTSPVPRRLMNAPSRATLSPRGERVFIFMHRGEPEDHAIFARNDVSWFLGVREPRGMSDCHEDGSPPSKEEGVRGGVARGSTAPNPSLSKEGNSGLPSSGEEGWGWCAEELGQSAELKVGAMRIAGTKRECC